MQDQIIALDSAACDASAAKVPRSKRPASPLAAVRHLLRHINDAAQLAANPLAADIFQGRAESGTTLREALSLVRAAIASGIDAIGNHTGDAVVRERNRRAAHILRRCDLDGAAHSEVAAELGLSRRQFYRDRSIALQLLAAEMEARLHTPSLSMHAVDDAALLAFESADALLAIGRFDDAKNTLERIARSTSNVAHRLRALCEIVEVACEEMREDEARTVLENARRIKCGSPADFARLALAESAYSTLLCRHGEAAAHRERAFLALRPVNGSPENVEMLVRAFLSEAAARRERGEARLALDATESAQALLDRRQSFFPLMQALTLNEQGAALMLLPDRLADASRVHRRAAEAARERRFMRIAFASLLNDCVVDYWQGKTKSALSTARSVLEAARGVVFSQEFARMALLVSTFALAANEPVTAFDLVEEATRVANDDGALRSRALLAQARLHLRTGSHARALELASDAVERLDRSGAKSLIGTAMLYAAEAYANLDHHREAIEAVIEAISRLENGGSPYHLSKAHRLAARLTGARSHARRAHEISAALGRSR